MFPQSPVTLCGLVEDGHVPGAAAQQQDSLVLVDAWVETPPEILGQNVGKN